MALRRLLHDFSFTRAAAQQPRRWLSASVPTVYDKMLQIQLVDREGRRLTLRGLEGQTLVDVLIDHAPVLGETDSYLCLSPEGRDLMEAHVTIPQEYLDIIPPPTLEHIEQVAVRIMPNSRMASKIVLTKAMDGMTVALAEHWPWETL